MFGSTEEKMKKLVKRGKWEKIKNKYLYSSGADELCMLPEPAASPIQMIL